METRTNGPLGDAQHLTNGAGFQALDRAQEQHLTQLLRQPFDFKSKPRLEFSILGGRFHVDGRHRIARSAFFASSRSLLGAHVIERETPDDLTDPCSKSLWF